MENSSRSQTLQDSPIRFGPDAFGIWTTIAALAGLLALVGIVLGLAVVAFALHNHGDAVAMRAQVVPFAVLAQGVLDVCAVVYLAVVLPRITNVRLADLGFRVPTIRQIGIALAGAVVMVVVVNGLGSVIDSVLHAKHEQEAIKLFLGVRDPLLKAAFASLAIVIAPIAEEFAFRVFLFNAVRRYGGFWIGAIVSGICFGLAHTDLYALVPLIFGGIVLCGVYAYSRNAWMSMITHAIFNGVSVIALYVAPSLAK